jgi:hypothetical protein
MALLEPHQVRYVFKPSQHNRPASAAQSQPQLPASLAPKAELNGSAASGLLAGRGGENPPICYCSHFTLIIRQLFV